MWKCSSYAGMMELVDMRDLGDVTSVKVFRPIIRRAHSLVKTGSSCFIDASQAQRSVSAPRRVKTEGNKIAAGSPAAHICGRGGIGRLDGFRCCHLGERFLRHPRRGHSSVKAGMPVFIAAGQALCSASVSSPSQNQRTTK